MKRYWYIAGGEMFVEKSNGQGWIISSVYGVTVKKAEMSREVLNKYGKEITKDDAVYTIEGWLKDCKKDVEKKMKEEEE